MICELLTSSGPFSGYAEKVMLYGRFVGIWDVEATWYDGGTVRRSHGQWHFAWVLGGRGVQDVLYISLTSPDRFDTPLRCYDAQNDVWHITWMQPESGEFAYLYGRESGADIVLDVLFPKEEGKQERRRFTEITLASFRRLGEVSRDGGVTWELVHEMQARRQI